MSIEDYWSAFGDSGLYEERDISDTGSLVRKVCDTFGIQCNTDAGGPLKNLDIKHMDAMTVIRYSLLEESANNGNIYEAYVNDDGSIDTVAIGQTDGGVTDIYHTIQTTSYIEDCKGVMITGGKPPVVRKPVEFKPIWGNERRVYDTSTMYNTCMKNTFSQYASIVFNDPHLDDAYEDGIDSFYERSAENPYDKILGYVYYKNPDTGGIKRSTDNTKIEYRNQANIPIKLGKITDNGISYPDLGKSLHRPYIIPETILSEGCAFYDSVAEYEDGVKVELPDLRSSVIRGDTVDHYVDIHSVYVIGREIDLLQGFPKNNQAVLKSFEDRTESDYTVRARISDIDSKITKLNRGEHYQVAYESLDESDDDVLRSPYIVFSNRIIYNDKAAYGTKDNKPIDYVLDATCIYAIHKGLTGAALFRKGAILPTSNYTGILVDEVWAVVTLDVPSINVYDPDGSNARARDIAENMEFMLSPIVITEPEAPVAFNGTLIDSTKMYKDSDPTTVQSFEDTDIEQAWDIMDGGGGLDLTFSFMTEDQVVKLSGELYAYMNGRDGVYTSYICGPNCKPQIGGTGPSGGIVNSINYSYSDGGSYTVSVVEGPRILSNTLSSVTGGPVVKAMENQGFVGTIIQDLGNHIHYKVSIDGVGPRLALNCCADILRVGDRVSCSVNNNPVES